MCVCICPDSGGGDVVVAAVALVFDGSDVVVIFALVAVLHPQCPITGSWRWPQVSLPPNVPSLVALFNLPTSLLSTSLLVR